MKLRILFLINDHVTFFFINVRIVGIKWKFSKCWIDRIERIDRIEKIEKIDRIERIEKIDLFDPTDPTLRKKPLDPIDPLDLTLRKNQMEEINRPNIQNETFFTTLLIFLAQKIAHITPFRVKLLH